jgi:DNA-binding Lrp family transcriptional regulator
MNRDNREDDVTEENGDHEEQVEVEVDGVEVEVEAEGPDEATEEEYEVKGEDLLSRVKELVREGNIRRITIRTDQGNTLIEIPLAIGVVGALLLPVWAAVGALAALVANCTIKVERRED